MLAGYLGDGILGGLADVFELTTGPVSPLPLEVLRSRRQIARDIDELGTGRSYRPIGDVPRTLPIYMPTASSEELEGRSNDRRRYYEQKAYMAASHFEAAGFLEGPRRGDEISSAEEAFFVESVQVDWVQGYAIRYVLQLTGHIDTRALVRTGPAKFANGVLS